MILFFVLEYSRPAAAVAVVASVNLMNPSSCSDATCTSRDLAHVCFKLFATCSVHLCTIPPLRACENHVKYGQLYQLQLTSFVEVGGHFRLSVIPRCSCAVE